MSIRAGVVVAVALEKIDRAPYRKTCTKGDDQRLQYFDCRVEEFHVFSSSRFDFEVYSEAQKRWLEVSSVSNFDNYQANRLKCRYRDENKKTQLCHTLNGSALALPRIVAALLENNQTPEGIRIPKALVPYTGFDMIK